MNNTLVQCNTSRHGGVLRLLLVFLLLFYFFSHLPFPKCRSCTKLTSGRRHVGGYRKNYWGILMVSPQSAEKESNRHVYRVGVVPKKEDFCSAYNIRTYGKRGTERGRSNMCLIVLYQ